MAEFAAVRRAPGLTNRFGGYLFVVLSVACFSLTGYVAGFQRGRAQAPRPVQTVQADPLANGGGLLAALTQTPAATGDLGADPLEAFMEVYHHLQSKYLEDITGDVRTKLAHGAIKGMLRELGDPYTRYMEPRDFGEFREDTHGQFVGIGAVLQIDQDTLKVQITRVFEDQPAAKAGLQPGDYIIQVNDEPTADMSLTVAVSKIRGEKGTKVRLKVERPDPDAEKLDEELRRRQSGDVVDDSRDPASITGKVFEVEVERAEIHVPVVEAKLLADQTAWVQLGAFNEEAYDQLEKTLVDLKAKGMKGLVLDVRFNPGGMLDEAVKITSLFVASGPVVHVQERAKGAEPLPAMPAYHRELGIPVVLLVNQYSASASEILAGALQDYDLATVVGEKTYGKGLVQTVVPLSDQSAVAITTAKYLTPHKRDINKKGIEPDVLSEWTLTNEQTIEHINSDRPHEEWDPQLKKALEVLRGKLQ